LLAAGSEGNADEQERGGRRQQPNHQPAKRCGGQQTESTSTRASPTAGIASRFMVYLLPED